MGQDAYRSSEILAQPGEEDSVDGNADHRIGNHDHPSGKGGWGNVSVTHRGAHGEGEEEGVVEGPCVRNLVLVLRVVRHRFAAIVRNPLQNLILSASVFIGKFLQQIG